MKYVLAIAVLCFCFTAYGGLHFWTKRRDYDGVSTTIAIVCFVAVMFVGDYVLGIARGMP
jgi:hypothetical protein